MRRYVSGIIKDFDSYKVVAGYDSMKAADVSGDGNVNAVDFALMRQFNLGMITKFPTKKTVTQPVSVTGINIGNKVIKLIQGCEYNVFEEGYFDNFCRHGFVNSGILLKKTDVSKTKEMPIKFLVSDIQEIAINSEIWDDFNQYKPIEMKFTETSDQEVIKNCDNNLKVKIDEALDKFKDTNISYAKFDITYKLKDNKTYQSNYTIPMYNE